MRILDRYILKSVLGIFLSCVFLFLFLYVIIDVLSRLEDLIKQQANIKILIEYYLYYLPIMLVRVSPFACLLATLYTFGRMNHANEIIAIRSSGVSILQISRTVIILAFLISMLMFWVSDRIVPRSLTVTQKLQEQMEESLKKKKDNQPNQIINLSMYGMRNRLFFINKFDIATNTMEGITILEQDEHQNITKKIVANKGIYKDNLWIFYQCITYNFNLRGQIIDEPVYHEEEFMSIPETPRDFLAQRQRTELMSIAQLDDYIWKFSRSGATTVIRKLKVDLYQRFTSPFTTLIITLLGIPFSLMFRKRATGISSIGLSITVGFLYYILDAISVALGVGGVLTPALAASLSHIIILSTSVYLISTLP